MSEPTQVPSWQEYTDKYAQKISDCCKKTDTYIREKSLVKPFLVVGIAFGLGFLIGKIKQSL